MHTTTAEDAFAFCAQSCAVVPTSARRASSRAGDVTVIPSRSVGKDAAVPSLVCALRSPTRHGPTPTNRRNEDRRCESPPPWL
jgi:hypothetical protein